jgi:hypothetical protein
MPKRTNLASVQITVVILKIASICPRTALDSYMKRISRKSSHGHVMV